MILCLKSLSLVKKNEGSGNRGKYVEGGKDPTTCPILYECLANSDELIQVSKLVVRSNKLVID